MGRETAQHTQQTHFLDHTPSSPSRELHFAKVALETYRVSAAEVLGGWVLPGSGKSSMTSRRTVARNPQGAHEGTWATVDDRSTVWTGRVGFAACEGSVREGRDREGKRLIPAQKAQLCRAFAVSARSQSP